MCRFNEFDRPKPPPTVGPPLPNTTGERYLVDRRLRGTLVVAAAAAPVVGLEMVALVGQLGAVVAELGARGQERVSAVHASQHVVGLSAVAARRHHQRQELHLTVPR